MINGFLTRKETVALLTNVTDVMEALPILGTFLASLGYSDIANHITRIEREYDGRTTSNQASCEGAVAG